MAMVQATGKQETETKCDIHDSNLARFSGALVVLSFGMGARVAKEKRDWKAQSWLGHGFRPPPGHGFFSVFRGLSFADNNALLEGPGRILVSVAEPPASGKHNRRD
jgi:hypothetical protein